jgi:hypothetical protein
LHTDWESTCRPWRATTDNGEGASVHGSSRPKEDCCDLGAQRCLSGRGHMGMRASKVVAGTGQIAREEDSAEEIVGKGRNRAESEGLASGVAG